MAYPYAGENSPNIYRMHGKLMINNPTSDYEDIEFCDHVQFPVDKHVERDSSELLYFVHHMILQLLPLQYSQGSRNEVTNNISTNARLASNSHTKGL